VSAGGNHTCAIDDTGVVCWGNDTYGQSTVPSLYIDPDGDGYNNQGGLDVFPLDITESLDTDSDGTGNNADPDDDNDGLNDEFDAFPLDATEQADSDGDGTGDNADDLPNDATETIDTDGDDIGNNADTDDDDDGTLDVNDPYPLVAPPTLTFTYGGDTSKPIAGITLTQTQSDSTTTTLTSDANGKITLPATTAKNFTLSASLTDSGTDPISVQDALYVLQYIVELRTLDTLQFKAADINGDSNITIQDALKVLQHNVELITIDNQLIFLDANTNNPLAETTFSPTDSPSITVYRLGDVNLSFNPG